MIPFARCYRYRAITLVEVFVVVVIIAVLIWAVLPTNGPRVPSKRIHCVANLKQVGLAFRLFAFDHGERFPQWLSTNDGGTLEFGADIAAHFRALSNEIVPSTLVCPADSIQPATNFATLIASNLSYFVGTEADGRQPMMIVAGDDNLTTNGVPVRSGWLSPRTNLLAGYGQDRHVHCGNVVMSDGHAEQLSSYRLGDYLRRLPNLTNRFLLP